MSDIDRGTAEREQFESYLIFHQFVRGQRYRLDFIVVRIVGWSPKDVNVPAIFERVLIDKLDWDCSDPAKADVFMAGDIKFDGESNWNFPNVGRCMIQFGNRDDADSLGRLVTRMYDIAAARIPSFEDSPM